MSTTPRATPSVLLLLSGTTTRHPGELPVERNTSEALAEPDGTWVQGKLPHSSKLKDPDKHLDEAV